MNDYKISPAEQGFTLSIISTPWIMKPVWGIISDSFPIYGYRRKSYLMIFGFAGFVLWMSMANFVHSK